MSKTHSIKMNEHTEAGFGYHLYEESIDCINCSQDLPVYLRLDGVQIEFLSFDDTANVTVTVKLPRNIACELGLLQSKVVS